MPFFIHKLEERGRRLPSIEEFACLLVSLETPEDACEVNAYGVITDTSRDLLHAIQTSDHHFRFMPGPEFSPRMYRGETEFHPLCVPSMFRDGIGDIDRCFLIGKWIELSGLMDHHPITHDLKASRIGELSFGLDIEAIAQHYGFKTRLMDFSRSREVAMFFATCAPEAQSRHYVPLNSGTAVLYTADLKGLIEHRKAAGSFLPLGFEPLPRPEAQRALGVRLAPNENLNEMPWISREAVEITPDLSQHYFDMFDGGEKLFPSNPFDDHVSSIRESKLLPLEALAFGLDLGLIPSHPRGLIGAVFTLRAYGYKVELSPMRVDSEIIQAASAEWARKSDAYYSRIRVRGVCDHMTSE